MNIIGKVAGVRGTVYGSNPLQYGSLASYAYLADGTKISALDTRDSTLTLYRGPFIMRRDSTGTLALDCILLPEGLVVKDGNSLKFITFVKDCLGSVRDVVDLSDGTVLELDDYHAFGERVDDNSMQTTSINRWRYNAKEEQDSVARLPYLDYGARLYDPVIGRWLHQDPEAAKYPHLSPYNFCGDNPVIFVDPQGRSYSDFDENGYYLRTIKDNWWHNLWHGRTGRILDANGSVTQSFRFADPKNDVKDIRNGTIDRIQLVQENEIISMLSKAGAFNKENKVYNN